MDSRMPIARGLNAALGIAGVLVIAWGMLLLITLGLTANGIGSAVLLAAYGVAVIEADRRAVALGWTVTILMGAEVVATGLGRVPILVWSEFFVLSVFLTDVRDELRGGASVPWWPARSK